MVEIGRMDRFEPKTTADFLKSLMPSISDIFGKAAAQILLAPSFRCHSWFRLTGTKMQVKSSSC